MKSIIKLTFLGLESVLGLLMGKDMRESREKMWKVRSIDEIGSVKGAPDPWDRVGC